MQTQAAQAHKASTSSSRGPPRARSPRAAAGLPPYLQDRAGRGEALPAALRAEMEGRFGAPLDGVRVHTDAEAAASAAVLGARAYTAEEDIVFGAAQYAPDSAEGRSLLAHELTHVVQQRRAGVPDTQPSAADGGARHDKAEREAEANARLAASKTALSARETPAAGVQREGIVETASAAASTVGRVAAAAMERGAAALTPGSGMLGGLSGIGSGLGGLGGMGSLIATQFPDLAPLLQRSPTDILRDMMRDALHSLTSLLDELDPRGRLTALIGLFTGLVLRASGIVSALMSGECRPLLQAIEDMSALASEVAGDAWTRLTDFLQPISSFFTDLWSGYGAPALAWLRGRASAVWARIERFGLNLWQWTEPVRRTLGDAWSWLRERLFGPEDPAAGGSGGLIGWVTAKAGEAWDWVKLQTAPIWQPIGATVSKVAAMLPPPWLMGFGVQMQLMSLQLGQSAAEMEGGRGVVENRGTLATLLPSVSRVIGMVRHVVVAAGSWVSTKVGGLGAALATVLGQMRANSLTAMLANALGWLDDAAQRLVAWAQQTVAGLFDWLLLGLDVLTPFVERAAGVLRRLLRVAGNLMDLGQLVLSGAWEAIPCCIRNPIQNFLFNRILSRVPVFGQFFSDPTLWPRVRDTALGILRQVFVDGNLAGAAWSFFQAVLRVLGLPPELVAQVLSKAAGAVGDILTNPLGFLSNLLGAVRAGFGRFFGNIGTHLLNGVSGWLFAQAEAAGVTPPRDFSISAVFGFVLQVLGITVEHIFERLAAKLDAGTVRRLRQIMNLATGAWHFLSILIEQGPAGLWVEIQSQLANLWDRVVEGVISWVSDAIIGRATRWLMSLLDVTGIMPVVNALVAVYNAIESFMQYLREMLEIVSRVLDGVLDIAHGVIDGVAGYLEEAMGRAMPVAIGFLANQLGLGRIGERMHELLEQVRALVEQGIDWLLDRAIALGQAFIEMARRGVSAVRSAASAVLGWLGLRVPFTAVDGAGHELYFRGDDANAVLTVESDPMPFSTFLNRVRATAPAADVALAQNLFDQIQALQQVAPPAPSAAGATPAPNGPDQRIPALTNQLGVVAGRLMPFLGTTGVATSSPPVYSGLSDGFGTHVDVALLTRDAAPGSTPGDSVAGGLWDDLAARGPSAFNPYYVRGHLLNHHLGGSGETWANLAPLTQAANNRGGDSMYRAFEVPLKNHIAAGREAHEVSVQASGRLPGRSSDLADIDAEIAKASASPPQLRETSRSVDELRVIRRIVNAEQHVPAQVGMRARIVDPNSPGTAPSDIAPNPARNQIDTDWTRYQIRRP